jgi:hypothetical protein
MPIDQVVREAAEIFTEVRAIIESIPDAVAKEARSSSARGFTMPPATRSPPRSRSWPRCIPWGAHAA